MKKSVKWLGMFAALLCLCLGAMACGGDGEKGTTYTYVRAEQTMTPDDGMPGMDMTSVYDTMYKGSTMTLTSKNIKWKMGKETAKMSYTKEGDKYILMGEYTKTMKDALKQAYEMMGLVSVDVDFYATVTDTQLIYTLDETVTVQIASNSSTVHIKVDMIFEKK